MPFNKKERDDRVAAEGSATMSETSLRVWFAADTELKLFSIDLGKLAWPSHINNVQIYDLHIEPDGQLFAAGLRGIDVRLAHSHDSPDV